MKLRKLRFLLILNFLMLTFLSYLQTSCGKERVYLPRRTPCVGEGCTNDSNGRAIPPPEVILDFPKNFVAMPSDRSVELKWDPVEGATSYAIYWNHIGGVDKTDNQIETIETSFLHEHLNTEKVYYYAVVARSENLVSRMSKERAARPSFGLYISKNGDDTLGDGSQEKPFASIKQALRSVAFSSVLHIAGGVYEDRLSISKPVQLIGGYKDDFTDRDVKLYPSEIRLPVGSIEDLDNPYLAMVEILNVPDFVKIEGLSIYGPSTAESNYGIGLLLQGSTHVEVVDTLVEGGQGGPISYGILVSQSYLKVESSSVSGGSSTYSYGISCGTQCQLHASSNKISGGQGANGSFGLSDESDQAVFVVGNQINTGAGALRYGVRLANISSKKFFANNTVEAIAPPQGAGFVRGMELSSASGFSESGEAYFINNTISLVNQSGSSQTGIFVDSMNGTKSVVANNIIQVISDDGYSMFGIYSNNSDATVSEIRNNSFAGCETAVYRTAAADICDAGYCSSVEMFENAGISDLVASGNIAGAPYVFDLILKPTSTLSPERQQGGIDGKAEKWGLYTDFSDNVRTNILSRNPSNESAGGWTIGAYEID